MRKRAAKPLRRADVWPKQVTPEPAKEEVLSESPKTGDEEKPKPRRSRKKKSE